MPPQGWIDVAKLKWPDQKRMIARLPLNAKQIWYAAQNPQTLIDLSSDKNFRKWWDRHYLLPLKIKRFFYSLKFW